MKLFSLFRSSRSAALEAFARSLAEDISKRYPPALDNTPGKRPSINRLTRILEEVCQKATEFQLENKLGVYGKAKLANTFKWALADIGYRKEFIDIATEAVVVHISKASQPKA